MILANYKWFVSPENQLILQKTVKKKYQHGSGGCNQISLKSSNSGFTCRSQKRFSPFYSSSKALSNDTSFTCGIKVRLAKRANPALVISPIEWFS